jgi:hypothetical protein
MIEAHRVSTVGPPIDSRQAVGDRTQRARLAHPGMLAAVSHHVRRVIRLADPRVGSETRRIGVV